jgi:hypothetical protein
MDGTVIGEGQAKSDAAASWQDVFLYFILLFRATATNDNCIFSRSSKSLTAGLPLARHCEIHATLFICIATHASVKKVVTCSRKMAILSHKIKIKTKKIKKNIINEKEQAYFL